MVKLRALYRKNGLLLAAMIRHGYTLQSLAKAAGVHYLTVWRLVNQEHRPTATTAARLTSLLAATPEELGLQPWTERRGRGTKATTPSVPPSSPAP